MPLTWYTCPPDHSWVVVRHQRYVWVAAVARVDIAAGGTAVLDLRNCSTAASWYCGQPNLPLKPPPGVMRPPVLELHVISVWRRWGVQGPSSFQRWSPTG